MTTALWQGISSVVFAGGLLWTCDGLGTGFGNSNDIPPSVNFVTLLDPTTLPYPKIVKKIDLSQFIGKHIKNVRKIKKSLDGTKIYVCTYGWYGEFADRGTHGNIDASNNNFFSSHQDPPGINGFSPNFLDLTITISGAINAGNNGTFPISADGNITNVNAVTEQTDSLTWHLNTPGQNVIGSPCGYVFIIDVATKNVLGLAQMKNGIIADGTLNGRSSFDMGDGSAARDCVDDGNGNLWVINASGGGSGDGISLLEKFNIAAVISNGPSVQTHATQQIVLQRHGEEICYDSGFLWTASGYVGDTSFGGGTGKGMVSRIDPSNGTITTYQDSTFGIFGMLSDSTGRSPFPGALYAFATNTFFPNAHKFMRFDPSQFPNPGFRTHITDSNNSDGGSICSDGTNLWMSGRVPNQADFYKLDPSNLTVLTHFTTTVSAGSGGGCWTMDFDGRFIWGGRRGFGSKSGLVQMFPASNIFQNAAEDNVMQLWNGEGLSWVMQARSSSTGVLFNWAWPRPDFLAIGYPGPDDIAQEIAVDQFAPVSTLSVVMQGFSVDDGFLTWTVPTEDFAGAFWPGEGIPTQIAVVSRNLQTTTDNIQIKMQAKQVALSHAEPPVPITTLENWDSVPSSPDFAANGLVTPPGAVISEEAVAQIKFNI